MNENKVYPSVEPEKDKIYRLAEAVASLVPAGTTMLQSIVSPPVQVRMEKWINEVEDRLLILESADLIDINELATRPEFSALLLRTIQAAAVTSQEAQLEVLRNFVVNISLNPNVAEDELYIILDIIGAFTPSHVKVLKFYHSPQEYLQKIVKFRNEHVESGKEQGQELAYMFGEGSSDYWQSIFYMVSGKHVITNHTTMIQPNSPDLVVRGKTTELGDRVVAMIVNGSEILP